VKAKILLVEDDAGVRYTLESVLVDAGYEVVARSDGAEALLALEGARFDLLVSDLRMPVLDGMGLLAGLAARGLAYADGGPPVIMVTAHGSERHAVEAMKAGAYDYFRKPFENDELTAVVARALEARHLRQDNQRLGAELNLSRVLLYASPQMARLAELIARVGPRDATVLITGESGTGKERVAEAVVSASRRRDRPFVRFNCAALSPELAEAELFGHTKGAFTGAHRARSGLFREADHGTLFLDEVGELDPSVQAKLLRALQSGEVRPVGEDHPLTVDVRIIAATHRDLDKLVAEGRFREDLHYRLKVVQLRVPPLRERPLDLPLLARELARRAAERYAAPTPRLTDELLAALLARPWPGNVRELENAMESMVALSADGLLDRDLLDEVVPSGAAAATASPDAPLRARVETYERGLIVEALARTDGNRSEAARLLGIGRATLHEKLSKHRIE